MIWRSIPRIRSNNGFVVSPRAAAMAWFPCFSVVLIGSESGSLANPISCSRFCEFPKPRWIEDWPALAKKSLARRGTATGTIWAVSSPPPPANARAASSRLVENGLQKLINISWLVPDKIFFLVGVTSVWLVGSPVWQSTSSFTSSGVLAFPSLLSSCRSSGLTAANHSVSNPFGTA